MARFKVGYLVGSLATKSINRLLAKALVKVAPPELELTEIPFKDLPLSTVTAVAQQHLRSILAFCNSPLMNSIEAYIQFEDGLISEDGLVAREPTPAFLQNYMAEFHGFIARVYTVLPRHT